MRECYLNTVGANSPIEVGFALFEVCEQRHAVWRVGQMAINSSENSCLNIISRRRLSMTKGLNKTHQHCNFSNSV